MTSLLEAVRRTVRTATLKDVQEGVLDQRLAELLPPAITTQEEFDKLPPRSILSVPIYGGGYLVFEKTLEGELHEPQWGKDRDLKKMVELYGPLSTLALGRQGVVG